jgi:hypothetical protein
MNKYLFVVCGPPAENESERAAGMAAMAAWYGSMGTALVDPGSPFTRSKTVTESGVDDTAIGPHASGYNIVQADSLAAATDLAKGCPLLKHGRRIAVFEILSMS